LPADVPGADPRGPEAPSVGILLVCWKAADRIGRCLSSLGPGAWEVLVVDNASEDGSASLVEEQFPWVRVMREPVNRGFAGAVNVGLRALDRPYVLLLNCDTRVLPGAIERLAAVLGDVPDCGGAGACLIGEDGTPQHGFHVRRFPTLGTWLVDLWLIDTIWPGNPATRRYRAVDQTAPAEAPIEVDQPAAACLMVKREAVAALGGMDERFFPAWFEDVDLCRRLRSAGWRLLFVPDARVIHEGGLAMRRLGLSAFSRAWYRNLQRYVFKHGGFWPLLACKALIASGMVLRIGAVLAAGRPHEAAAYARVLVEAIGWWKVGATERAAAAQSRP
jgi:GT2 family glycosyltransferase